MAEPHLGVALERVPRNRYVIAKKDFFYMNEDFTNLGLNRKHVIDSLYQSLDRLNLKYVDLFYCHRYYKETSIRRNI